MEQDEWLTVEEIATTLKIHPQTVRRWIKAGEFRVYQFGDRAGFRIKRVDLDSFLERRGKRFGKSSTPEVSS